MTVLASSFSQAALSEASAAAVSAVPSSMSKTLPWRTTVDALDAERPQRAFDRLALRIEDAGLEGDGDAGFHGASSGRLLWTPSALAANGAATQRSAAESAMLTTKRSAPCGTSPDGRAAPASALIAEDDRRGGPALRPSGPPPAAPLAAVRRAAGADEEAGCARRASTARADGLPRPAGLRTCRSGVAARAIARALASAGPDAAESLQLRSASRPSGSTDADRRQSRQPQVSRGATERERASRASPVVQHPWPKRQRLRQRRARAAAGDGPCEYGCAGQQQVSEQRAGPKRQSGSARSSRSAIVDTRRARRHARGCELTARGGGRR